MSGRAWFDRHDSYRVMKWYGTRGDKDVFEAPDGSHWLVNQQSSQNEGQKVAWESWIASRRRRGGGADG